LNKTTRTRAKKSRWRTGRILTIVLLINLFAIVVVGVVAPEISLGKLQAGFHVEVSRVLVEISGSGWLKPPSNHNSSVIQLDVLVKNMTLGSVVERVEELNGEKIVFFEFTVNNTVDYSFFKNISVHPDVRVKPGIASYTDVPPYATIPLNNGCYLLVYTLAYQMNVTMQFCYYYVDASLIIENKEAVPLLVSMDLYRKGDATERKIVRIPPGSANRLEIPGYSRIIIRDVHVDYGLFRVEEKIGDEERWVNTATGEKTLYLTKNIHLVLIPVNAAVFVAYTIVARRQSKSIRKQR